MIIALASPGIASTFDEGLAKIKRFLAEEQFYVPGQSRRLFELNGLKFGVVICHAAPTDTTGYTKKWYSSTKPRRIKVCARRAAGKMNITARLRFKISDEKGTKVSLQNASKYSILPFA